MADIQERQGLPLDMSAARTRYLVSGTLLLILAAAVFHIAIVDYSADDGFISFRYADHLARGQGLVYNIGERVEGYTNFLWVALLAAARFAMPAVDLPQAARVAGTAATLLIIVLTFRCAQTVARGSAAALLAAAFLAAHSSLAAWSAGGLETSLFTLLVFAGASSYLSYRRTGRHLAVSASLFALAAMTRPDGVIFFAATLFALLVSGYRRDGRRPAVRFAAVFLAIFVPYFIGRSLYFGDLFPNTAYAKVALGFTQLSRGARYVWNYVVEYGVLAWILPVLLYLWRSREEWLWYFAGLIAVYLAYIVYVGGDGLAFHRFIAHIAPFIYTIAAAALVDFHRRYIATRAPAWIHTSVAGLGVAVVLALTARTTMVPIFAPERVRWFEAQSQLSFPGNGQDHSYVWFDNYFVDRLAAASRYLQQHAPPGSLVAATPAGAIAYYMDHPVIDMLGLTDKHIARAQGVYQEGWVGGRAGHEKGDGAYVLSRAPDYILMGNVAVFREPLDEQAMWKKLVLKSEHELWDLPEFHRRYELVSVRLSNEGLFQYFTFFRKKPVAVSAIREGDGR
jgi:arabinofuranosyltransferase